MAKNPLPSAGDDVGSIPNQETGPMCCRASPRSATTEPVYPGCSRMHREYSQCFVIIIKGKQFSKVYKEFFKEHIPLVFRKTQALPKDVTLILPSLWGVMIQHMNFGGTQSNHSTW